MKNQKRVAFYTLGCKLNFSETSTIARSFVSEGFERVDFSDKADIYVINTCSVTENADKRFKTIVKQAQKLNPEAFLIAIGCYAQLKPEVLAQVNGVDLVLGATEKFNITNYLNDLTKNDFGQVHSCEIEDADFYVGSYSFGDRTRAFPRQGRPPVRRRLLRKPISGERQSGTRRGAGESPHSPHAGGPAHGPSRRPRPPSQPPAPADPSGPAEPPTALPG